MTEREYINAGDLAKLNAARLILSDICADNSPVIIKSELSDIVCTISNWQHDLANKIILQ